MLNLFLKIVSDLREISSGALSSRRFFIPRLKRSSKTLRCQTLSISDAEKFTSLHQLMRLSLKSSLHLWLVQRTQSFNSQLNKPKYPTIFRMSETRNMKAATCSLPSERAETIICIAILRQRRLKPKFSARQIQSLRKCRFATKAKTKRVNNSEWLFKKVFYFIKLRKQLPPPFQANDNSFLCKLHNVLALPSGKLLQFLFQN